jgi:hypothetical protein
VVNALSDDLIGIGQLFRRIRASSADVLSAPVGMFLTA